MYRKNCAPAHEMCVHTAQTERLRGNAGSQALAPQIVDIGHRA